MNLDRQAPTAAKKLSGLLPIISSNRRTMKSASESKAQEQAPHMESAAQILLQSKPSPTVNPNMRHELPWNGRDCRTNRFVFLGL
jgi:hypothetical protein